MSAEDKAIPTVKHIRARGTTGASCIGMPCFCHRPILQGDAFSSFEMFRVILQDDVVGALCGMLRSLRLWNRVIDALSHLAPLTTNATAQKAAEENPLRVSSDAN